MATSNDYTILKDFPRLSDRDWRRTSPYDAGYNCHAWAAGDSKRWWEPARLPPLFWPLLEEEEDTPEAFISAFKTLGYLPCESPDFEPGWEKIAIFTKGVEVTHSARQLPNGRWTSKLGKDMDIEHVLDSLEGTLYGSVTHFLKRLTKGKTT